MLWGLIELSQLSWSSGVMMRGRASLGRWRGRARAEEGAPRSPWGKGPQNGMGSGLGGRKPGCQRGPRLAPQPPLMQKPQLLSSETPGQGRTCAGRRITRGQCSGPAAQTLEGSRQGGRGVPCVCMCVWGVVYARACPHVRLQVGPGWVSTSLSFLGTRLTASPGWSQIL